MATRALRAPAEGGALRFPGGDSLLAVIESAASTLAFAGCDTPRLDAELLAASVLGCDRAGVVVRARERVDGDTLARFRSLIERRVAREPVAYILGRKGFRQISLFVDRRVLIPRPETELLVEVGLGLSPGARVVDVGTGCGAVALALKDERPDLHVIGTDIHAGALVVARENAVRLGLDVEFVCGDLLVGRSCDAVLANLPYVADGADLPRDVADYEPRGALFAGAHGLDVIRRLIEHLPPEVSTAALEIDPGQAAAVTALGRRTGFRSTEVLPDLAGFERVVVARR